VTEIALKLQDFNLQTRVTVSSSRSIAVIGLFSALYIVTSGLTSFVTQVGYPEHFLRGILMTAVILRTGRKWSATIMGVVCGLVFALVVPAPAPYLLPSTIISGIVFDLALIIGSKYDVASRSQTRLLIGAGLSGLGESVVALSVLTIFAPGYLGKSFNALTIAWSADVVLNIILSIIGALIAFRYLLRKPLPRQSELTV
jgi:hypothetical protein